MVLSNDISEIRAAGRALRRSEHMLERSQSTAHVGQLGNDAGAAEGMPEGAVRWSDEMFRIFGCEPGSFPVTYASFFASSTRMIATRCAAAPRTGSSAASWSRTNFASSGPTGPCG